MKTRIFSILALLFGLLPGMSLTAYAASISYVDGSGATQTVDATELASNTTSWTNGSWYIVPEGGLTVGSRITVNGTVNLILRDGATLTASAGITTTNATLNIYAQSAGTGALTANGSTRCAGIGGVGVDSFGSNGGAGGTVSIFGGTVTATGGTNNGSYGAGAGIGGGGNGPYGNAGASGTLTLGVGVKLYNGTDNTGTVLDNNDSESRSYSGSRPKNMFAEVTVSNPTVTANEGATGEYWATYYNGTTSFTADENTTVFQAALSGSRLTLTEVPNREIPATKAVILKSSSATITLTPASTTETLEGNGLQGTATSITNPGNAYVLNKTETNGVGFYKLSSTGTIGANKAYLTYSGSGAGAREYFLFEDETTGIEMPTDEVIDADAVVYDLQGRRVAQPTKGLYIVNGKKVIIK